MSAEDRIIRIAEQLDRIDEKYERKVEDVEKTAQKFRQTMRTDYSKFKEWVQAEIQTLNDYITRKQAYEQGLQDAELKKEIKSGDTVPYKQLIGLSIKLVGVLGTALAIIMILLRASDGS
jgi:hypothetical protein